MAEIGLDDYKKLGLASSKKALIKILGSGELTRPSPFTRTSFPSRPSRRSKRPAARPWYWVARRLRRRLRRVSGAPGLGIETWSDPELWLQLYKCDARMARFPGLIGDGGNV